jgi:hypothetical protein
MHLVGYLYEDYHDAQSLEHTVLHYSVSFSSTRTVVRKTQPPKIPKHPSGHDCTRKYSRTPLIRTNWDCEPSGHADNPDNWIFL